ncbi:hypothetical protein CC1G_14768 [Coprinopsis cinerea okayama7|uniref:Uncharacterized protein n=1 Tax=Coprinopsis cinerea (strain Okayama-7 / 130 / ATCC MYA-4618 / FGSC 9003) TaxID=240176 RepID=D6RNN1_COPC7|nr:hypothetical protein CC1G_14768 [Coprinopsis cinerea okayama7\|eukprot:XP_002910790.1 hypothetical protein CC1G_14768 [Coprinopsis cinerea okayama7\
MTISCLVRARDLGLRIEVKLMEHSYPKGKAIEHRDRDHSIFSTGLPFDGALYTSDLRDNHK